jgi:hypothetical protein
MDGEPPQSRGDSRRLFQRRHRPRRPESLHGLGWLDVLKHAWWHIKASWVAALAGAVVAVVLPVLIQWGDSYGFSESGWDKVTANGWIWSVIAVAAWLVLVALWHFLCAPMGHAREVLALRERHHAAEIERVRLEKPPSVVNVGEQHNTTIFVGENPDPATIKAFLEGRRGAEPFRQVGPVEEKPRTVEDGRPSPAPNRQVKADRVDDVANGPRSAESGR